MGNGFVSCINLLTFQVLIEANERDSQNLENNEDKKVKSTLRNSKEEGPVESNVEMDSRLLSALLTVSKSYPAFN